MGTCRAMIIPNVEAPIAPMERIRRLTKSEEEAAKKKEELAEQRRIEDEERRKQEDKIIEAIEADFWAHKRKIAEGTHDTAIKSEPRCGPGMPAAAPSLDALI